MTGPGVAGKDAGPGLGDMLRPGCLVALADGVGSPRTPSRALAAAARRQGPVRLLLGWQPRLDPELDLRAFHDVRALMGGWGLRDAIDNGLVRYLPTRLGAAPALLAGPLRPDILVASVVPVDGGYAFGTEVAWMRSAVASGATVAGVVSPALPHADAGPPLPRDAVVVIGRDERPPFALPPVRRTPTVVALAEQVARLIPEGARVQVGLGALGTAVLGAIERPVRVHSGLLPESVVDLHERGLLIGEPVATYLAGGPRLYAWAHERPILHALEAMARMLNDQGNPAGAAPLVSVNTALEVDLDGQVNVEGTSASTIGGIGGHPDYCAAAAASLGGLSVIALASVIAGRPTLRRRLSRPVSTPSHDVEILVTERGCVDLRGLDREERRAAILALWDGQIVADDQ